MNKRFEKCELVFSESVDDHHKEKATLFPFPIRWNVLDDIQSIDSKDWVKRFPLEESYTLIQSYESRSSLKP